MARALCATRKILLLDEPVAGLDPKVTAEMYALIVNALITLCSSLLGVTLVLKRFSFIGDGLSHVAFGATAIAMISVGALAIGYLIMNLFSKSSNLAGDVCATLFDSTSILTLTETEVWLCVTLSVLVIAVFMIFYHKIFTTTFDGDFSAATGVRAKIYNLILAVVIAVVIVLAMNLVGALLISVLVIFPALSAMRVFKSFKPVIVCSVIVSVTCTMLGILISIAAGTSVGSTIVAADIVGFAIFNIAGFITRRG